MLIAFTDHYRGWISYQPDKFINFWSKTSNICWFHLVNVRPFFVVVYDSKLRKFAFWTVCWTKEAVWGHCLGLWEVVMIIFIILKQLIVSNPDSNRTDSSMMKIILGSSPCNRWQTISQCLLKHGALLHDSSEFDWGPPALCLFGRWARESSTPWGT